MLSSVERFESALAKHTLKGSNGKLHKTNQRVS